MKLTIEPRDVYGVTKYYPACDSSRVFVELLKQQTLTTQDMKLIMRLGYELEFQVIHKPPKELT